MNKDLVAIVVPVWNRAAQAIACLQALTKSDYHRLLVIVVDNGSEQPEARVLSDFCQGLDKVRLIRQPSNLGFSAGVNLGLKEGFANGAAAALVLNSDAIVEPGAVGLLYKASKSRAEIGIVGPRIIDPRGGGCEVSRGERLSLWTLPLPRRILRHRGHGPGVLSVGGVLGCAMVVTRECYQVVGPLADNFFAYYEEVDYCLRARAKGFSVVVVQQASVWHQRSRGFGGGFGPLSAYLKSRNLLLLMGKHASWWHWPGFLGAYALMWFLSSLSYLCRRRVDVVAALMKGALDGAAMHGGPPPAEIIAAGPAVKQPGSSFDEEEGA